MLFVGARSAGVKGAGRGRASLSHVGGTNVVTILLSTPCRFAPSTQAACDMMIEVELRKDGQ